MSSNSYGSQYPSGYQSQGQPSSGYYYPVPQQAGMRSSPYPGQSGNSAGTMPPRPSTYPQPGSTPYVEERASKRRRPISMDPSAAAQMQAQQWAGQGSDPRYAGPSAAHASHAHGYGHSGQMKHPSSSTARRSSPTNTNSRRGSNEPEEDGEEEPLDHGPTELPPRTYQGQSKYNPPKKPGKIPGSAMDYLPILEARFDRLESAIDRYVDYRGQRALSNSILPGSSSSKPGQSSRR